MLETTAFSHSQGWKIDFINKVETRTLCYSPFPNRGSNNFFLKLTLIIRMLVIKLFALSY